MSSFTRIITETLKSAEERATAVSRMLTESTATATKGVMDNLESMNRSATSESRKAAEAVRESNKALVSEMGQSVGEATRRFAEATREMRTAMQELQRELNTTREELKRGVLDIPEEAREGADTMRRVVGDQIKALSDLSEIITRHGKQLDLSSPALGEPRMARAAVEHREVDRRSRSGAGVALCRRHAPQRQQRCRRRGPSRAPHRRVRPLLPAPVTRAGARGACRRRQAMAAAGCPISSAGRRPTRKPTAPRRRRTRPSRRPRTRSTATTPRHRRSPTPLNALSADIARAIDHDAAQELWERHRRGERNLFTRRLYTMQGQQTFDEIRKKYQRDPEFRSVVDHYVADFEKLLTEATGNNRDSRAGSQYLTVGHRQGLHHAGPCQRPLRLSPDVTHNRKRKGAGSGSRPFSLAGPPASATAERPASPAGSRRPDSAPAGAPSPLLRLGCRTGGAGYRLSMSPA